MNILWDEWTDKYKWELLAALIAITLIIFGIFIWVGHSGRPDKVQVLGTTTNAISTPKVASASGYMIDVSGAVIVPGVYTLAAGSRVDDALKAAGGLDRTADTIWVAANINRAEKIRDGMKLFIPAKQIPPIGGQLQITPTAENNNININSASADQLDALKGVGPVTAQKIISGRPYANIDDLLNKKIVSQTVFNEIKDQIQAW